MPREVSLLLMEKVCLVIFLTKIRYSGMSKETASAGSRHVQPAYFLLKKSKCADHPGNPNTFETRQHTFRFQMGVSIW